MNLKKTLLFGSVALSVLVLSGCKQTSSTPTATLAEQGAVVITYDGTGFNPEEVKVKTNQKIIFKNTSNGLVQVNSDPHPTHTLYPDLNVDVISANSKKDVTLGTVGTYRYHNHIKASQGGVIVVE